MRFKACKEAGLKEVSIIKVSGLSAEKQREFLIKDNVSGGEWDWQLLQEWDSLELESWGLDIDNYDNSNIDFETILGGESLSKEDAVIILLTIPNDNKNQCNSLISQIELLDKDNTLKAVFK
jgi:hypothetical protein